jgi:zinc protease
MNRSNSNNTSILESLFRQETERFTLPNGLTVLFNQNHASKLVSTQVWIKTGSIHEGEYLGSGLSHYLEHMLFKGTKHREGPAISREVEAAGGYINAYTSFDRTVYYIDLPSENIEIALNILADIVFDSTLPEEEIDKEKEVILREIDMTEDDPDNQVYLALFRNAFCVHPYRYPVIGFRQTFENISHKDLLSYYQTRYVPNNAVLVVAGDFNVDHLRSVVKDIYGRYSRKCMTPAFVPNEPPQLAKRQEHLEGDVQICRGMLSYRIPSLSHPHAPALDILASVMGSGHSSILWQKLRQEKKLVHSIDASIWNPGSSGLFVISYLCDPDKREKVEAAIYEQVEMIARDGIESKRIKKAIRQAIVAEINSRKTVSAQASKDGMCEVVLGDLDYPRVYFQRIQKIVPQTLLEILATYFTPNQLTTVSFNQKNSSNVRTSVKKKSNPLPDFKERVLDNGVRILFQVDHRLPQISLHMVHPGGPLYEQKGQRGITRLMATHLTRDTAERTAAQVAEAIETLGGTFGEFSGNNSFGLSMEILSEDFSAGLELFEQGLLNPTFNPETFSIERQGQIACIKQNNDDIVYFGRTHLRSLFFGEHPLSLASEGTESSVQALCVEDILKHYKRLLTASNTIVAIAGDFDPEKELLQFQEVAKKIPDQKLDPPSCPFVPPANIGLHEKTLPREQAVVYQAYPDTGMTKDDFILGEVLEELFNKMSGNLFINVREKQNLAYFVGATRILGMTTGMFYFYGGTQPDTCQQVFNEIDKEVVRVQSGHITEEELHNCKIRLKAQKHLSMQTPSSRAMQACLNVIYELPPNNWRYYEERLDSLTPAHLQCFAQKYFQENKKVCLVVKP